MTALQTASRKLATARDEFIRMEDDGEGLAWMTADEHEATGAEIGRLAMDVPEDERQYFIDGEVSREPVSAQHLIACAADYVVVSAAEAQAYRVAA